MIPFYIYVVDLLRPGYIGFSNYNSVRGLRKILRYT